MDETLDSEVHNGSSAEASIKSLMQLFVKVSAGITLDGWNESDRYLSFNFTIIGQILNTGCYKISMTCRPE